MTSRLLFTQVPSLLRKTIVKIFQIVNLLLFIWLYEGESYELELTYNYGHGDYDLGNGYGHIALGSEHFEADHKKHRQAGFPVTDIKELADKSARYYFIQDPDGYKIEVIDLNN